MMAGSCFILPTINLLEEQPCLLIMDTIISFFNDQEEYCSVSNILNPVQQAVVMLIIDGRILPSNAIHVNS